MSENIIAVIGGSGLYDLPGLTDVSAVEVDTPFGKPSGEVVRGTMNGAQMLFLARHGKGHRLMPGEVNYRANVFALKKLGATHLISVSAVGSLREDIVPGDLVVVRQYIDRTRGRSSTFFGNGIVGHVVFADPVCPALSDMIFGVASAAGHRTHDNATLVVMEGPAFSTRAESHLHRQMGGHIIGMTAMPEAKLAREAELCHANLALATDYDCWHETEEDVTLQAVLAIMHSNVEKARAVLAGVTPSICAHTRNCGCGLSLESAIVTDRALLSPALVETMKPVFGRVL
jgi:5'-methylthioadenosine phosphorylase